MDWDGLKRRTRQVTRMPFPISNFIVTPDSRSIVFVTTEPAGVASVPVIYSIQDDGRREGGANALRHASGIHLVGEALQQDREVVAPNASDGILTADTGLEATRPLDQQLVAGERAPDAQRGRLLDLPVDVSRRP